MSEQIIPKWFDHNISDRDPTVWPMSLATKTVRCDDPPRIGIDDDRRLWYEIEVSLIIGGQKFEPSVRFPAHEPLSPQLAFTTVVHAVLGKESVLGNQGLGNGVEP